MSATEPPVTRPVAPAAQPPADRGERDDYPIGTYATIKVEHGASTAWPVVERVGGGWQSGEHHYPDAAVTSVRPLPIRLHEPAASPARDAASVLSDGELAAALGLWHRLRDDDGTLIETVAEALFDAELEQPYRWADAEALARSDYYRMAAAAISAVRGEVR